MSATMGIPLADKNTATAVFCHTATAINRFTAAAIGNGASATICCHASIAGFMVTFCACTIFSYASATE